MSKTAHIWATFQSMKFSDDGGPAYICYFVAPLGQHLDYSYFPNNWGDKTHVRRISRALTYADADAYALELQS